MDSITFIVVPILDKNQKLFGHRVKIENQEEITKENFLSFIENFSQKKNTFIKLSKELLESPEILDALDKKNTILITDEFVDGFKIATYVDSPNVGIADFILIRSQEEIEKASMLPAEKVVENVNTLEEFEQLKEKDVDYFEGYFFLERKTYEKSKVSPSKLAILNIFNTVVNDFNINKIEEELKRNPDISIELLRFINSAAFSFRRQITSIRHAVSLLGQRQFLNWLLLSIYLADEENKKEHLFELAAIRGKMIEILSKKLNLEKEKVDEGFLVGILSIIDLVMEKPKEELINEISVSDDIKKAVLSYEGIHGQILKAIELIEKEMLIEAEEVLKSIGLSVEDVMQAQLEAIMWFNQLTVSNEV